MLSLDDRYAIEKVLMQYARAIDRRDWDLLADCYHDDAIEEHGSYVGDIQGFIASLTTRHEGIRISLHYVTNIWIHAADESDSAVSESYCLAYQEFDPRAKDALEFMARPESRLFADDSDHDKGVAREVRCRYIDNFEYRAGRWRISRRRVVYETMSTYGVDRQRFPSGWITGTRDAEDLGWAISSAEMGDQHDEV